MMIRIERRRVVAKATRRLKIEWTSELSKMVLYDPRNFVNLKAIGYGVPRGSRSFFVSFVK